MILEVTRKWWHSVLGNGDTGTPGGRKGTQHREQESIMIAFSFHMFPYSHGGIKPVLSKQSSATLSPTLAVPLLTRNNIGYSAGRSTGVKRSGF